MLASTDTELDNGPRTDKSATMRMCAVSREVRPTDELIRFVLSPDGTVVPDIKRKLPGRGVDTRLFGQIRDRPGSSFQPVGYPQLGGGGERTRQDETEGKINDDLTGIW